MKKGVNPYERVLKDRERNEMWFFLLNLPSLYILQDTPSLIVYFRDKRPTLV
jgi:hypothetical protein